MQYLLNGSFLSCCVLMGIYLISRASDQVKNKTGSFKLVFSFPCLWVGA